MHKCIVCGNTSTKTRRTRPGVIYHGFPKNEYIRRKWLKALGINLCYDWQRICSDHFLEENYKPGIKRFLFSNTVPQPYNRHFKKSGFPSNIVTQRNDVATGNNNVLPIEQNIVRKLAYYDESDCTESEFYRKEHIENAVINTDNIESSGESCKSIDLTTDKEDNMSCENMPSLQTDQFESQISTLVASDDIQTVAETDAVPVSKTNMNHTFGYGLRCSVKNCFNRHSKDLSLFGYPKDLELRKKWIEKCGLEKDLTERVINGVRVCSAHFDDDCFKNSELKNRLKPGSVPSLSLDDADDDIIIDTTNIPSTSSPVKSADEPSCSSSNYVANGESNQTPLLVYMDSTTRNTKDFEAYCSVPGCITNTDKEVEDVSLFAPTTEFINEWSSILGLQLTVNSIVCERHFLPQDILNPELLVNGINKKVKSLAPYALPLPVNEVPVLKTYEDQFISPINNKTDEQSSSEEKNNVLDNADKCSTSNTSISIHNSTSNNSLSINLEPIENCEVIEPSVDLSISPRRKSSSSELLEIKTSATSKSISSTRNSDTHDTNAECNTNTSQSIIVDVNRTKNFKREENGFIFEISKKIVLPSLFWKSQHLSTRNATGFYQRDTSNVTVKKVHFYNRLVPVIQIYGKKYEYHIPIKTKKELEYLLEKIDNIEKCYGRNGFIFEKCIGYFENSSDDIYMCSACQDLVTDQDLQKKKAVIEVKSKTIGILENKIAKRAERILELKKALVQIKKDRKHRFALQPSGFSNIMKP